MRTYRYTGPRRRAFRPHSVVTRPGNALFTPAGSGRGGKGNIQLITRTPLKKKKKIPQEGVDTRDGVHKCVVFLKGGCWRNICVCRCQNIELGVFSGANFCYNRWWGLTLLLKKTPVLSSSSKHVYYYRNRYRRFGVSCLPVRHTVSDI